MAETLTENQTCKACGADVRAGALFCYNCGGALASEITVAKNNKKEASDNAQLQESVQVKENKIVAELEPKKLDSETENGKIPAAEITEKPIEKLKAQEKTELKSAAAMRGKSKLNQPKRVEIIWEESENAPNLWFISIAVFLTIVAAVILFLAIRMK